MQEKIDVQRCRAAMLVLSVEGSPVGPVRQLAIEDTIRAIQMDAELALRNNYTGVKNYAEFGDQRDDHAYGMGPRLGTTAFKIGRRPEGQGCNGLGADAVYLLECVRDFGAKPDPRSPDEKNKNMNLCDVLREYELLAHLTAKLADMLTGAKVETHAPLPKQSAGDSAE